MITMVLGGLWHGAAWTFVVWGAYHGLLLCLYRLYGRRWDAMPVFLQRVAMFGLVVVGWTLFRAESWEQATTLLQRMLFPMAGVVPEGAEMLLLLLIVAGVLAHVGPNSFELRHQWRPAAVTGWALVLIASLVRIWGVESSPFLYFQF